jgi:hypothetical protein
MSQHNYNNHGRSPRPSHTGGDSHSGSFMEQGRTTLPSLTEAFPTFDPPGSFIFCHLTHLNSIPLTQFPEPIPHTLLSSVLLQYTTHHIVRV